MSRRFRSAPAALVVAWSALAEPGAPRTEPAAEKSWSNDAELSLVATQGNSATLTFGVKDRYRRSWDRARFEARLEATRADKAADPFVRATLAPTGVADPSDPCASGTCRTVELSPEDSIERYLVEGRYHRELTPRTFWNAGGSWDRTLTDGSGIENRWIAFAGIGHLWWDEEALKFQTNYNLSYTEREETTPDPAKEDSFGGLRLDWTYLNGIGQSVVYTHAFTLNYSLADSDDYTFDMTNAVSVAMNDRVALKVGVQWLFSNVPPLRTVDLECVDPAAGDPAATLSCALLCVGGDGAFLPCTAPGALRLSGETDIRKKDTDLIFNTALVIKL